MTSQEVKRKLAAILSADVKGYSRLMGEDEKGTVRTLNAYKEVMTNLIQQHRGRVVDAPGDNVLAEFGSVVDAVECAVEIQKELKTRNADLPKNRKMEFRIGVNLGDVIEDGEQILGDGVNIAARLESLSEAGGICISGTAFDQVRNKLGLGYDYLGEQTVKNIALPVRVYKVLMEPEAVGKVIGEKKAKPKHWQMATMGLVIGVIVVVVAVVIWKLYTPSAPQPEITLKEKVVASPPEKVPTVVPPSTEVASKEKVTPPPPKFEKASKEKMAFPLPDKPSIAVLPFVNMSDDPKQDYLGDGLSEDIITALSKVGNLFVIARESSFSYKGKPVKVKQVAEELAVRYVLEGSVRQAGGKLRITAQLIDAIQGHHLWAERFDRELKDIFAVQDQITKEVITALEVYLTMGEEARLHSRGTESLEAYLKVTEGRICQYRNNKEENAKTQVLIQQALNLDPNYAAAYLALSRSILLDLWLGASKSPRESLMKAIELAKKAIELDNSLADAQGVLGRLYTMTGEHEKGIAEAQKAVELDPNSAAANFALGFTLNWAGRHQEAIPYFEKAIRLNPLGPPNFWHHMSIAYYETGQYEKAIAALKSTLRREPKDVLAYVCLTVAYMYAGREEEGRAAAAEVLRLDPDFSAERFTATTPFKDPAKRKRYLDAFHKAGLK